MAEADLPTTDPALAWQRLRDAYERIADLPVAERPAALARLEDVAPGLRRQVESLLAVEADDPTLGVRRAIEQVAVDATFAGVDHVGPYRLVGVLGEGGMGVVHLAERADGAYRQRVAVKRMRWALAGSEAQRRFVTERQILATLEHPGVARLLDGGTAADGSPFLVMEYVDGEPIDRFCEHHHLGIAARCRLMLDVCAAISHAHRQLIVHRDLKPSNILVTPDGQVKVLDFGIAKLLDPNHADQTRTQGFAMTPAYASPEQVRGEAVSTATDVYALGVILYELLTGQSPHRASGASAVDLLRAICEDDPPRPSAAVRSGASAIADEGANARARRLQGDLDAIVTTALAKRPVRRYPSVEALAEDLQRWLDGLPVRAHPDSLGYRARKWVRRHRAGVVAAALVALALAGGVVSRMVEARRAERAAATASRVSELLFSVFDASDPLSPETSVTADTTARELLERGAARALQELADQPQTRAEVVLRIGKVLYNLSQYQRSADLLGAEVENARRDLSPNNPITGHLLLWKTYADLQVGKAEGARQGFEEVLAIAERAGGDGLELVPAARAALGDVLHREGQSDEAVSQLELAVAERTKSHGEDTEVAIYWDGLAKVLFETGRLSQARGAAERCLAIRERILGLDHPVTASALGRLGNIAVRAEAWELAETTMRRAYEIQQATLGDHIFTSNRLCVLGRIAEGRERWDEAVDAFERCAAMRIALEGDRSPRLLTAWQGLGRALRRQGQVERAQAVLEHAIESLGRKPALLLELGRVLSVGERGPGQCPEALALADEAMAVAVQGDPTPEHISPTLEWATIAVDCGKADDAASQLERLASVVAAERLPSVRREVLRVWARVHSARGALDLAARDQREADRLAQIDPLATPSAGDGSPPSVR